ncbi:MAG: DUF3857 domain-containing protein [Blastocatellia bacterium]
MSYTRTFSCASAGLVLLCVLTFAALAGEDWKPVDPAHLSMKTPVVEKDADAEAIFWEVYVDDASEDLVLNHYIRIKVFNERGVESQSKVEIPYFNDERIKDIKARTIKPDGSIVELSKDSIYDRTVVKASGVKLKAKTFAMPGVEPGAIIEYRWREAHTYSSANNLRLHFQREIPVQMVRYYLKPSSAMFGGMKTITFHGKDVSFVKEKNGFSSVTMNNMPAYREEPRMPPVDEVRTWMLVYYSNDDGSNPQAFWGSFGRLLYEGSKDDLKVNDDVRKAAAEITSGATTPDEKLQRILGFVRTKIRNTSADTAGLSAEEKKKLKKNNSPADTLKRGYGSGPDLDMLFAALAAAAGFEARLAFLPDRSDIFFTPNTPRLYSRVIAIDIAVRVGDEWRFFDPSSTYVPFGMLRWQQEGVKALITDPKAPSFINTPISASSRSMMRRTAKMKLHEDGTLEGDVAIEYSGHFAIEKKNSDDDDTAEKREQSLRDEVRAQMSTAELSNISIENVTDPVKPYVHKYHVKVPGYAQRTGKRLFLQPSFFMQGRGPMFTASERRYPIYFHYPWAEYDEVEIELPPGYALDNAEAPQGINAGQTSWYKLVLGITPDSKTLIFKRDFQFGGNGDILFPVTSYASLKKLFDAYHQLDSHTITLKQAAAPAAKGSGN